MKYFDFLDNEDEKAIRYALESEKEDVIHGVIVFNIDNFVIVNEMFDRAIGDSILVRVNDEINRMFRGSDIVVKLRGDEFIVLNKNIKEIHNIEILAAKLLETISQICVKDSFYLTASVGLSIYPFHGRSYVELKNKAYQAMYRAKANGKNSYRLYDSARTKAIYHEYIFNRSSYDDKMSSEEYFSFDINNRFKEVCVTMFHENIDALSAMNSIMELSCLYLGFSRVYMYTTKGLSEVDSRKLKYANAGFEFGKDSATKKAIMSDLQARIGEKYTSITLINADDSMIDDEVRITLEDEGISQLLFYPIRRGEMLYGGVVFENMTDDKVRFEPLELERLDEQMSCIQAYFFNTYEKKFSKESIAKLDMFENLPASVYIIDAQTHIIEYANQEAMSLNRGSCVGQLCYEVLCGKQDVCEECPLKNMNPADPHSNATGDMYNYHNRKWIRNIYSWMDVYENRNKAVAIGVDVDDYVS